MNGAKFLDDLDNFGKDDEPKLPKLDFEKGSFHVKDVKKQMDESFRKGKARGLTTHIPAVDKHFSWKVGELTCVTGYAQNGKTEFTLYLMLLMALYEGWRWIVYSPENYPADELFDTLIHTYIGESVDPAYANQMPFREYERGQEFINEHFTYIYPGEVHTPEVIREYVAYWLAKKKYHGTLKDPWNKMTHLFMGREDQYLASQFPLEQKVARENQICSIIAAHPRSPGFKKGDSYDAPSQYQLSGGAMWDNMFDNILCVHRPEYLNDKSSTITQFHSLKIKKQKLVGIPGMVEFDFERRSNRYLFNGSSPLVKPGIQPQYIESAKPSSFPVSEFESPNLPPQDDLPF